MVYSLDLELRIDQVSNHFGAVTKKKMFGGVGYFLNGNLAFGILREYLIVRTSVARAAEMLKTEGIRPFDGTGRPMKGWVLVSPDLVETDDQLIDMLQVGTSYVATLPPK